MSTEYSCVLATRSLALVEVGVGHQMLGAYFGGYIAGGPVISRDRNGRLCRIRCVVGRGEQGGNCRTVCDIGAACCCRRGRGVPVSVGDGQDVPLLDEFVVTRLELELEGGEGIWRLFVEDFLAVLPVRSGRLRQALTSGDARGAMDAVLSLRTSSQMVGAVRLAGVALELERSLRAVGQRPEPAVVLPQLAADQLPRMVRAAAQTETLLTSHLHGGRFRKHPRRGAVNP